MNSVKSNNGVPIRLTDERWEHIIEEHAELTGWQNEVLDTISIPSRILEAGDGALLAVREVEAGKFLVVVYKEFQEDGFVITAFLTRRTKYLDRRKQVWP